MQVSLLRTCRYELGMHVIELVSYCPVTHSDIFKHTPLLHVCFFPWMIKNLLYIVCSQFVLMLFTGVVLKSEDHRNLATIYREMQLNRFNM